MPDEPHVEARPEIPVRITVRREQHDGMAPAWRGQRVDVRRRGPMGTHQMWVPAADVARR